MTLIEDAIERRLRRGIKMDIIPIIRILNASREVDSNTLIHRAYQLNHIHKELERKWEEQKRINWSKGYDRWYEYDRKKKEMIKAKMADRWPRRFWKYWGFVSEEAWNSYMERKKTKPQTSESESSDKSEDLEEIINE